MCGYGFNRTWLEHADYRPRAPPSVGAGGFRFDAEVVVRLRAIRPQRQRSQIRRDGLVRAVERREGGAQVRVEVPGLRLELDGPAQRLDRDLVLAFLVGEEPELVVGFGVVRPLGEDLAIDRFGVPESAGVAVPLR
jgi:hypothetical protein